MAFATAISSHHYQSDVVTKLRDYFISNVHKLLPDATLNGAKSARLPGIVNFTFPGTQSDTLLLLMDSANVSCSTGSACSAGVHEASHVLLAMGHTEKQHNLLYVSHSVHRLPRAILITFCQYFLM